MKNSVPVQGGFFPVVARTDPGVPRIGLYNGRLGPIRKNSNPATRRNPLKRGVTVVKKDIFSVHVQ